MNTFESLVADFAKMTGLPLSPDERGGCALETDGLFITIQYRAEADDIALIGGLPFKDLEVKEFCKSLDEFVSKAEEWRETVENFRPAAEEAAIRDEEAAQFSRFGGSGPGFMSV